MRTRPYYFAVWFPITVVCAVSTARFFYVLLNSPSYPAQGMEALAGLPILIVLGVLLPFVIGLFFCVIFRPPLWSLRMAVVLPTVIITSGAIATVALWPKKGDKTYPISLEIVDSSGRPFMGCTVQYILEIPEFLHLKNYRHPTPTQVFVPDGHLTIQKKRSERLLLDCEAQNAFFLHIDIGQWCYDVPDYIHKIDFFWRRDRAVQTPNDSMSTSLNWRPIRDKVLRVVMLRHTDQLVSPYPPYTEERARELDQNRRN